jgi:hypothetical protein
MCSISNSQLRKIKYGSWIYNYLCNQCLSPLNLLVRIPLKLGVFDTTLCDKDCQGHATGRWLSPGTPVSSTNKTDRNDITEILLKVTLNIINKPNRRFYNSVCISAISINLCYPIFNLITTVP